MNRGTTGRMARKNIKFHLFHECMHRTVRIIVKFLTMENFRLRARDASVGENEVLNSTNQILFCSYSIVGEFMHDDAGRL